MKKFLKIAILGALTFGLISISNTKINYLHNGNNISVEKVKLPRKNLYGDESLINDLEDLSYTEWHQSGNISTSYTYLDYLYSYSDTQVKICDIINWNNETEIREVYSTFPSNWGGYIKSAFGYRYQNNSDSPLFNFYACKKNSHNLEDINFFSANVLKFYDLSTFSRALNSKNSVDKFLNALKSSFNLYIPEEPQKAYIQVNENINEYREELDKNFQGIEIEGLSDTYGLNEKIDISSILNNQEIEELEIHILYNDLPTIIYSQFSNSYPILSDNTRKYTISGSSKKQWGDLTWTLKYKINDRTLDNTTLNIYLINYQHTINALRGKSFILNTNINIPTEIQGTTNYIDIRPAFAYTNVVQPGFYVSYVYNQDKVLNEYMNVYSTNFYKYVMRINSAINTSGDLGIMLYDNDNSPKVSGTPLYNFTKNSYIDNYSINPRVITFTNQFNTNNLITMNLTSDGEGSSFIFDAYKWLTDNATLYEVDAYETGYAVGYSEGLKFSTSSTNWIEAVFRAVDNVLQVEILPNFKLWYIVAIPLLFGCVMFVFKILR